MPVRHAILRRTVTCVLLLAASLAVACGSEPSEPSLLGTWIGTYDDAGEDEEDYKLVFNANGSMTAAAGLEDGPQAEGTWKLTGLQVDATYSYEAGQQFTIRGTMSEDGATMTGTYGPGVYPAGLGYFTVEKQ